MDPRAGLIIAGKFRLERPLARGGMGSVWVAFNTQLEVPVAVKFMAPALVQSADLVARFQREAKAAAQLRNPHVVQIFEYGVEQGTPYMAMELLEGEDLAARLKAQGRLSLMETARILGDVCKGLQRAHENRIVHRDLKPQNIFLCKHDGYEVVKVLDFGIAKSVGQPAGDGVTQTGAIVGSPHYMAPEQARRMNQQVDHRSDLWSLGVIAFRCITGKLPYAGDDLIDVLVRVCSDPVPPASSVAPDVGPTVDRFFERALAREPDKRFQSVKEMAEALNRLAGREASPPLDRSWSDVQGARVSEPGPRPPAASEPRVQVAADPRTRFGGSPGPAMDPKGSIGVPTRFGDSPGAAMDPKGSIGVPTRFGESPGAAMDPKGSIGVPTRFGGPGAIPPPRGSQPGAQREIAVPDDEAKTVPIHAASAQKVLADQPWKPSGARPLRTMPIEGDVADALRAEAFKLAHQAAPAPPPPIAGAPAGSGLQPTLVGMGSEGTLTSSGAEVSAGGPRQEKPWVVLAAVGATILVVGIITAVVLLGREGTADGTPSGDAPPLWPTSAPPPGSGAPSAVPVPSAQPTGTETPSSTATSSEGPGAVPTTSSTMSAEPAGSTKATGGGAKWAPGKPTATSTQLKPLRISP